MTALLLVAVVFAVLYGLWTVLHFIFDLIEHAHADSKRGGRDPQRERETSGSH